MKSNTIKYLLLVFSAVLALAGCTREFAEVTELDLTRCMMPRELTATVASGNQVTFEWIVTKEAEEYTIALSESESFDTTDDYIVPANEVPYTIELPTDKTYFWRVMAQSKSLQDSKWSVADESFSTYPVRPALNPVVTARTENTLSIKWDDASDKEDLNSVWAEPLVKQAGEERLVIDLTPDEIASCTKTVEGLKAGREYKVTLVFGLAGERGSVVACTRPDMGEGVVTVTTPAELYNAVSAAASEARIKVAFSDNAYDMTAAYPSAEAQYMTVAGDLYLYGESTEEGKKPVVSAANFKLAAGTKTVHFEDIAFDGNGVGDLIDNDAAELTAVELVNCEVSGYGKAIYVVAEAASATGCATLLVDDCYMHDINADGKSGGDFIDVRAGVTGDVTIKNSTFYAVARSFMRFTNNAKVSGGISIENCTFNYVTATPASNNNRGIYSISVSTGATAVKSVKNVFLNEVNEAEGTKEAKDCWIRLCRSSNDSFRPDCDGNVYYNIGKGFLYSTALDVANQEEKPTNGTVFEAVAMKNAVTLTEDPCVNSAAGKLYLDGKAGAQIVALKAGDPRWWNAVQPEVIRETELTVAPDEYTWDFTEKTIYDTEEITVPTIIGNARIYAIPSVPAQVVMSEGITFSQGAALSGGVPQYSGVGILTSGYGSVKVVAEGTDATVEVVAAGDRYPVLADGKEHTVVLGDLSGENNIYVIADKEVTLKSITWTKSLTPEETVAALDAPALTMTPNKLDQGTAEDVVITWDAVTNAADYVLTWNGSENTLTEPTFTIPAADVAALAVGEYVVSVIARPVSTSTKYRQSEAAEATLKINKVETGSEVTLKWDFSSAEWVSQLESHFTAINTNQNDINFTYDGLTVNGGGKSMKYNVAGTTYFVQPGGGGKPTERFFSFEAPASGTLTVYASNTGNSEDLTRLVAVKVGDAAAVTKPGGYKSDDGAVAVTFDVTVTEPTTVVIYPSGNGLRFYGFEFTYTAAAPSVDYVWDFSSTEWVSQLESHFTAINTNQNNINFTYDGLTVNGGGKSMKYNVAGTTYFVQPGGGGKPTERFFSFEAPASGTLTVYASNTGNSEDLTRLVAVKVGDAAAVTKPGGYKSDDGAVAVTFDVTVTEPTAVVIYPSGNGLRFYGFEFHSN